MPEWRSRSTSTCRCMAPRGWRRKSIADCSGWWREKLSCRRAAEGLLRNELRGEITSILLNCELALREARYHPGYQKLRAMYELAQTMRCKLEGNGLA